MVGTAIAVLGSKKLLSIVESKFETMVIRRWSNYRAKGFIETFLASVSAELKTGAESTETDAALEAILEDEAKSELLWDSYRAVCLARSKNLGPKIIGFLTGYLVAEGRSADSIEDQVFAAAETLSDGEIIGLFKEFRKYAKAADACKDRKKDPHWVDDSVVVPWDKATRDSARPGDSEIDVSPLNFAGAFEGSWALRAERLGLLSSRITQRVVHYREDSERHIDQDGVLTIHELTVTFEVPCRKLCDLIERSLGAAHSKATLGT